MVVPCPQFAQASPDSLSSPRVTPHRPAKALLLRRCLWSFVIGHVVRKMPGPRVLLSNKAQCSSWPRLSREFAWFARILNAEVFLTELVAGRALWSPARCPNVCFLQIERRLKFIQVAAGALAEGLALLLTLRRPFGMSRHATLDTQLEF